MKIFCEECSGAGWKVLEGVDPDDVEILEECKACDGCGYTERNDLEELVQIGLMYRKEWEEWLIKKN